MIEKPLLSGNLKDVDKINYPVLVSPKLDGIRALTTSLGVVSRSNKPIRNTHVQSILQYLPSGLDGELMAGDFQNTTSVIMSSSGGKGFVYWIFDYVETSLFEPFTYRLENLKNTIKETSHIKLVPHKTVNSPEELLKAEEEYLSQGYEGLMLRDPQGPYKCGRSTTKEGILLRMKRFTDSEAIITGFVELMRNKNQEKMDSHGNLYKPTVKDNLVPGGTLGKFLVKDIKSGAEFGLGSGLNDAQRREVWSNQSKFLGKLVKYKYQAHGSKNVPRLPIFLGFRED